MIPKNTTIIHNAPIEPLENFSAGKHVFLTGHVFKFNDNKYTNSVDSTNCICSAKSNGNYKEFVGICVKTPESKYLNIDTIDFATHGDFLFTVDDSDVYSIGDHILNDEINITSKLSRMIIGIATSIVDKQTIGVFKA